MKIRKVITKEINHKEIMKTLIGSKALSHYIDVNRKIKDTDYFSDTKIKGADCFYHPDLEHWDFKDIATPRELYTIKLSHSYWNIPHNNWDKHIFDMINLKKECDAHLIPELHDILYPIWEELYGKKKVNLNQEPEEFFNSNVTRKYQHDSIHAAVAYGDSPLFNKILKDGHKVAVSKEKFGDLSFDDKLRLVREEVYATACERIIIPTLGMSAEEKMERKIVNHPHAVYHTMLKKTITDFSTGWFPQFILDNMEHLVVPDVDYVQRLKNNKDKLVEIS